MLTLIVRYRLTAVIRVAPAKGYSTDFDLYPLLGCRARMKQNRDERRSYDVALDVDL